MRTCALVLAALVLGACNTGFLRDEPPQTPALEKTPRLSPSDSRADARDALEKIAAEKFTNLEEVGGELRVVRRSNQHIWACNAWVGTARALPGANPPAPGRHFVVATAEMDGEPGGSNTQAASLGFKPLPPGTSPTTGECESKLASEFPDIGTSVFDRLLP